MNELVEAFLTELKHKPIEERQALAEWFDSDSEAIHALIEAVWEDSFGHNFGKGDEPASKSPEMFCISRKTDPEAVAHDCHKWYKKRSDVMHRHGLEGQIVYSMRSGILTPISKWNERLRAWQDV